MDRLSEAVRRAVDRLSRDGIEGWGLQVTSRLQELGELVAVAGVDGCVSSTCGHHSHDPAAPTVRWVPRDGVRIVLLGEEPAPDDQAVRYYAVLSEDGAVIYAQFVESVPFWARLMEIDEVFVPDWALASLAQD